jgi:type I restriction enzyme S subunit
MEGWTANQHSIRIIPSGKTNPGFLYAWLASDYGYVLTTRFSYGSVILEFDRDMLGQTFIPRVSREIQNKIGDLILRANDLRDIAWNKEQEAIKLLEKSIIGS